MDAKQLTDLRTATQLLETTGLPIRIAGVVGAPIEKVLAKLPAGANEAIARAAQKAVGLSLDAALKTMRRQQDGLTDPNGATNRWHKAAVAVTGAGGGAFGLAALAVELPISTTIMMRSIADIARSEGANLGDPETQLECIQVLTLGGLGSSDDAADLGYIATRQVLATSVSEATKFLATSSLKRAMNRQAAPQLVRFITQVAQRFSVQVSNKAAAQMVPILGAAGGALINAVFIDHFQKMARGHFVVRRLERLYGSEPVQEKYLHFRQQMLAQK
ncbi:MAG: EcsC family protein [Burkholderiales bacterium]